MDADYRDEMDMVPEATFKHHEESIDAGRVVMELGGELDMFISAALSARFHELAEDGTHDVVVDLTKARYIDTHVLETFVTAQHELEAHDHALAVVADTPYARRTLELTGLDEQLRISSSRDEAVARLGA
jgi:anti-sigma B factor antagonist